MVDGGDWPPKSESRKKKDKKTKKFRGIGCASRRLVRIVAKCDGGNLDKMNHFMKATILSEFCFVKHFGWRRIHG